MTKIFLPAAFLMVSLNAQAEGKMESPRGKPIVRIFTDFHAQLGKHPEDVGFELNRSYLGYTYTVAPNLTFTGILDVGQSKQVDDYHRIAYIKNIMVEWKHQKLTLKAGLLPTIQFSFQEKFWGLRYVHKSFQDQYKFGHSADLGITARYTFNKVLTAEAILANGEGYKKVQLNDGLLYGAGVTVSPLSSWSLRLYGGINQDVGEEKKDIYNLSLFTGYRHRFFSVGAEYNLQKEKTTEDIRSPQGYSIYTSATINQYLSLFGRYDKFQAARESDKELDEKQYLIGAQISFNKYIRIAPTCTITQKNNGTQPQYGAGIYCYLGF